MTSRPTLKQSGQWLSDYELHQAVQLAHESGRRIEYGILEKRFSEGRTYYRVVGQTYEY